MSKIHLKTGKGCFTYEAGTTLEAISRDFQEDYPHDIILARVDGKLAELNSCMDRDAEIEFITTGEAVGNEVYLRQIKGFSDQRRQFCQRQLIIKCSRSPNAL